MSDCIFCKIVAGDIPSHRIYENDDVVAFLDITQVTPGHTLLIPKKHAATVFDWDTEIATAMGQAIPRVARQLQRALPEMAGLNIVNNNHEVAYQTVFHTHVHLIPRYDNDDEFRLHFGTHTPTTEELAARASQIAKHQSSDKE